MIDLRWQCSQRIITDLKIYEAVQQCDIFCKHHLNRFYFLRVADFVYIWNSSPSFYLWARPIFFLLRFIYHIFRWAYIHLKPNVLQISPSNVASCIESITSGLHSFSTFFFPFPRMSQGESITRKVSQLTNQIRRDIKKTNDPGEMGADKCVLFSPGLPPSLASSQRARAWRVWIGDLITEETVRASGARAREGRWRTKRSQRTKWGIGREKGDKPEIGEGKGEGKVDEYENYSLDARTGRTLVKMAHGIN